MIKFMSYLSLLFMMVSSPLAHAGTSVSLTFNGNIKASSCTVSDINLNLGTTLAADLFYTAQSGSNWQNFNINLTNCSPSITQAKLTFSGTADTNDINSLYKNQGTAQNVAVQLKAADDTPLGNTKTLMASISSLGATIPLKVRAFSSNGGGTPGTIYANITATIIYL